MRGDEEQRATDAKLCAIPTGILAAQGACKGVRLETISSLARQHGSQRILVSPMANSLLHSTHRRLRGWAGLSRRFNTGVPVHVASCRQGRCWQLEQGGSGEAFVQCSGWGRDGRRPPCLRRAAWANAACLHWGS